MSDIVDKLRRYSDDALAFSELKMLESLCGRLETVLIMRRLDPLLSQAADKIEALTLELAEAKRTDGRA